MMLQATRPIWRPSERSVQMKDESLQVRANEKCYEHQDWYWVDVRLNRAAEHGVFWDICLGSRYRRWGVSGADSTSDKQITNKYLQSQERWPSSLHQWGHSGQLESCSSSGNLRFLIQIFYSSFDLRKIMNFLQEALAVNHGPAVNQIQARTQAAPLCASSLFFVLCAQLADKVYAVIVT